MLRKVTKAVGRLKPGTMLDYPRGVWNKMAQDAEMKLEDFTVGIESNAVLQSSLKSKPVIRTRLGAAV